MRGARRRRRGSALGDDARWKKSSAAACIIGATAAGATPLRLGLLCDGTSFDGTSFEAWEAEAVTCLLESGFAAACLIIVSDSRDPVRAARSWDEKLREFALRSFQRLSGARAVRRVDLAQRLAGIPVVRCPPLEPLSGVDQTCAGAVCDAVDAGKIDVILKLGSARVDEQLLSMPRHGVWGISRTREDAFAGGPPSFWEVVNGKPVTGGCLYRMTGSAYEGTVLREGYVKTTAFLPGRSLDAISFECARWPMYAAAEIVNGAPELATLGAWRGSPQSVVPSWSALARYLGAAAKGVAALGRRLRLVDEWHVGVLNMKIEEIRDGKPLKEVRWLPNGPDAWYADPIVRTSEGETVVLVEKMPVRGNAHTKGHIASVALSEAGWGIPEPALDTGSHASYPYLIETGGRIFMTPETSELNELGLYEAIAFPNRWKKIGVLLPGIAATDATVFEHADKWWIFCTTIDAQGEVLLAFYADSLFGPWRGHRRNPLKVDVRGARPAGRPFVINGTLYRPSQDCSRKYGGRIVVQAVLELDPDRWSEVPAFTLAPEPAWLYNEGIHTLSIAGDVCIIDAKRDVGLSRLSGQAVKLFTFVRSALA